MFSSSMLPSSFSFSSLFLILLLISFLSPTPSSSSSISSSSPEQPTCINNVFADSKHVFTFCNDLPVLNSFIHWNYDKSTQIVDIAYRHTAVSPSTWVAWAINPTSSYMIGSQAFVAFQGPNGTIRAYTSPITSYRTHLEEAPLSFPVHDVSATFTNNEMTIFATFELPKNGTTVNQLWQDGPVMNGDTLGMHRTSGPNVQSFGTLDFLSGHISKPIKGGDIPKLKIVHGVLNAVTWGTLLPLGAIIARNLRRVNSAGPAWFYLHILCQTTAYLVGVVGLATGLILGKKSSGIQHDAHRNIGLVLSALATLQVFALCVRPKPDHKWRSYWNIYHLLTGYAVILLSVSNVFIGINILDPEKKWMNMYIGVIASLGGIALVLELIHWTSWYVTRKRKRNNTVEKTVQAKVVVHSQLDDDDQSGPQSMV